MRWSGCGRGQPAAGFAAPLEDEPVDAPPEVDVEVLLPDVLVPVDVLVLLDVDVAPPDEPPAVAPVLDDVVDRESLR